MQTGLAQRAAGLALLAHSVLGTRVGIMYEAWHAHAYWGRGTTGLTMETIIRSDGDNLLSDMAPPDATTSANFYWMKEPADSSFYCIYRKRSNETTSPCGLPDCPNITQTLQRHAAMLLSAGVDFVTVDSTNIQSTGPDADCIQLRPWEVLAEEWLALRKSGTPTPDIAIWQNIADPNGDLWEAYTVDGAYTDPAYADMIFTDDFTQKKVFFVTRDPDDAIVGKLEALNYSVVTMWAQSSDTYDKGDLKFFSECVDGVTGKASTSVFSFSDGQPCGQQHTTNAGIGSHGTSLTVSPSYQLSYSALPFQAAGKLGGLTLKRQFETAFALHASGELDYLFIATFNEHIAQAQPNPFWPDRPAAVTMGLEGDPEAPWMWVDMLGDSISRDLEPTVEDGGATWDLLLSCMRVFASGASSCANYISEGSTTEESCCDLGEGDPQSAWLNIWAIFRGDGGEILLTADANEKDTLLASQWGVEICAPFGGAGAFCGGNSPSEEHSARKNAGSFTTSHTIVSGYDSSFDSRGPFLIHAMPLPAPQTSFALWRCYDDVGKRHFATTNSNCSDIQGATPETILGYLSGARSTDTPRSLRLCEAETNGLLYHSLDMPCVGEDTELEANMGFVH